MTKLRDVSSPLTSPDGGGGGGGGGDVGERLATLEEKVNHLATESQVKDVLLTIEQVKTLISEKESSNLRWLIGTALVVTTVLVSIFLAFIQSAST